MKQKQNKTRKSLTTSYIFTNELNVRNSTLKCKANSPNNCLARKNSEIVSPIARHVINVIMPIGNDGNSSHTNAFVVVVVVVTAAAAAAAEVSPIICLYLF